jgi:hypothetical protein
MVSGYAVAGDDMTAGTIPCVVMRGRRNDEKKRLLNIINCKVYFAIFTIFAEKIKGLAINIL